MPILQTAATDVDGGRVMEPQPTTASPPVLVVPPTAAASAPSSSPQDSQAPDAPATPERADAGASDTMPAPTDAAVPGVTTMEVSPVFAPECSRAELMQAADAYLVAMEGGDPESLALHEGVRYTENGQVLALGLGLWLDRPRSQFSRQVIDVSACSVVTQAVLTATLTTVVFGVRLRYLDNQLFEAEAQVVRPNAQYYEPAQIDPGGADTWVAPLDPKDRRSGEELTHLAMRYFDSVADPALLPPHADGCERRQNGELMPNEGSCGVPPGSQRFEQQRYPVVDISTGIVTAVVKYTDYIGMYLIKVHEGKFQDIEVIGGAASATTGW